MDDQKVVTLNWSQPKTLIECGSEWMATAPVDEGWRGPGVYAWIHDRDGLIYIGMARKDLLARQNEHYRAFIRGGNFIKGLSEYLGRDIPWLGFPERNKKRKQEAFEDAAHVLRDRASFLKLVEFAFDYAERIRIYVAPAEPSWSPATIPQIEAQLIWEFCSIPNKTVQNERGLKAAPGHSFKWDVSGPPEIVDCFTQLKGAMK
jgi:hypothetical protein